MHCHFFVSLRNEYQLRERSKENQSKRKKIEKK